MTKEKILRETAFDILACRLFGWLSLALALIVATGALTGAAETTRWAGSGTLALAALGFWGTAARMSATSRDLFAGDTGWRALHRALRTLPDAERLPLEPTAWGRYALDRLALRGAEGAEGGETVDEAWSRSIRDVIATALKAARAQAMMTQEHLSGASGVSVRTIRRAESTGQVSCESLRALCATLNIPLPVQTPDAPAASTPLWYARMDDVTVCVLLLIVPYLALAALRPDWLFTLHPGAVWGLGGVTYLGFIARSWRDKWLTAVSLVTGLSALGGFAWLLGWRPELADLGAVALAACGTTIVGVLLRAAWAARQTRHAVMLACAACGALSLALTPLESVLR